MCHELLTKRAHFCICKKDTLNQHFVTHVPPLGCKVMMKTVI